MYHIFDCKLLLHNGAYLSFFKTFMFMWNMNRYIRRVRVTGLFNQSKSLVMDFEKDLNCIYGFNGTGKTVLIDLIVNVLKCNIDALRNTPFYSITLLTSSKKQPEKFLTVSNEFDDVYYEFHNDYEVEDSSNLEYRLFRNNIKINKDIKYVITSKGLSNKRNLTKLLRYNEDSKIESITPNILKSVISGVIGITYVPLRRYNDEVCSKSKMERERSSDSFLTFIQEEFSKQYAAAQSGIARNLETLSSTILEKLLLNQNEREYNYYYKDVEKLIKKGKPEESSFKMSQVASQIKELKLDISIERIQEHYNSWYEVQMELINCRKRLNEKKDEVDHDSFQKYTEAFFNYVAKIGMYNKLQEALVLIEKVYYKKYLYLMKFENFKHAINDFLSETKQFSYDDDGTFRFQNNGRTVKIEHLSSGEKHLIAILGYLCISGNDSSVFIADEPELSLHLEWQRKILPTIKKLSPNTQVIVATHSPAIISKDSNRINIENCYQND